MPKTQDLTEEQASAIEDALAEGGSIRAVAKATGASKGQVERFKLRREFRETRTGSEITHLPQTMRPQGQEAKGAVDKVLVSQAGDDLEELARQRRLRERETNIELAERESEARQKKVDALREEVALLQQQGPSQEIRDRLAQYDAALQAALQAADKAREELREEKFQKRLDLIEERLTGKGSTQWDVLQNLASIALPKMFGELQGIREGITTMAGGKIVRPNGRPITGDEADKMVAVLEAQATGRPSTALPSGTVKKQVVQCSGCGSVVALDLTEMRKQNATEARCPSCSYWMDVASVIGGSNGR